MALSAETNPPNWFFKKLKTLLSFYFLIGRSRLLNIFFAYQPDSYARFGAHSEFDVLFRRFVKHNRRNNSGDITRLWAIILNLKQLVAEGVYGDFAELGVWRGNTAAILAYFAARNGRHVYLFDTFEGFDSRDMKDVDDDKKMEFKNTSITMVRNVIGEDSSACTFVQGYFPDVVEISHESRKYAAVSLDCDLYEPMRAGLHFFYPRMPCGGLLILHDYSSIYWNGAQKAIDEFCKKTGEHVVLMPDKSGSAFIRKTVGNFNQSQTSEQLCSAHEVVN